MSPTATMAVSVCPKQPAAQPALSCPLSRRNEHVFHHLSHCRDRRIFAPWACVPRWYSRRTRGQWPHCHYKNWRVSAYQIDEEDLPLVMSASAISGAGVSMKLGMITDSVPDLDFQATLALARRVGLDLLEFGCGNWSSAPHLDRAKLLADKTARDAFLGAISDQRAANQRAELLRQPVASRPTPARCTTRWCGKPSNLPGYWGSSGSC